VSEDPFIHEAEEAASKEAQQRFADLFDVRRIIAALFAVYGVVLLVLGFFASDADVERAQGFNVNLWVGLALLVTAAIFLLWALRAPVGAQLVEDDGGSSASAQPGAVSANEREQGRRSDL
jgi:uncharacterized membrane protein